VDTFIVRIYRRTLKSMQELAGTVEHVGSGRRAGFASREQLLDRLLKPDPGSGGGADGDGKTDAERGS
jgi:hypothetical protein